MSEALTKVEPQLPAVPMDVSAGALELAIGAGDFSKLTSGDRLKYLAAVCASVGLNPLTKPIEIMNIAGKIVMYANKGCAEQLRKIHGVNIKILERGHEAGVYFVKTAATAKDGREDEAIGAVALPDNATGEIRANAMMKAETKAKRRVTLSICGLGMLDVSEVEDMKPANARAVAPLEIETSRDRADTLNAEIEPEPEKESQEDAAKRTALAEQLKTVLLSLAPEDSEDGRRKRAALMDFAFGESKWPLVVAMNLPYLEVGIKSLQSKLEEQKAAPTTQPDKNPEPVQTTTKPAEPAKAPTQVAGDTLAPELQEQVAKIIGPNMAKATVFCRKRAWLGPGQGLEFLSEKGARAIIGAPEAFLKAIAGMAVEAGK